MIPVGTAAAEAREEAGGAVGSGTAAEFRRCKPGRPGRRCAPQPQQPAIHGRTIVLKRGYGYSPKTDGSPDPADRRRPAGDRSATGEFARAPPEQFNPAAR